MTMQGDSSPGTSSPGPITRSRRDREGLPLSGTSAEAVISACGCGQKKAAVFLAGTSDVSLAGRVTVGSQKWFFFKKKMAAADVQKGIAMHI